MDLTRFWAIKGIFLPRAFATVSKQLVTAIIIDKSLLLSPPYLLDEKPDVSYSDIGGMDIQKQEVREAVELPLTHFDLYKQIGIDPPRGVLMYGPPGCGKTMLAKAVAHHTTGMYQPSLSSNLCSSNNNRVIVSITTLQQ